VDSQFIHLEHDGKLLLVDLDGNGPAIPKMGRSLSENGFKIRLPTPEEVSSMGISWKLRRTNKNQEKLSKNKEQLRIPERKLSRGDV